MSIQSLIQDLAKRAVMSEVGDLPGLVELQDKLLSLSDALTEPDMGPMADVCRESAELVEAIVFRSAEDEQGAIDSVKQGIEYLQQCIDTLDQGGAVADVAKPGDSRGDDRSDSGIDEELLAAWVSSCQHLLTDLEGSIVEVENSESPEELIAEIRRGIHTLKGECGVLSLHQAQHVCHEAETNIDAVLDSGRTFPVDAILALVDWMKAYTGALGDNPTAAPPPHDELLATFSRSPATAADTVADPTETTDTGAHAAPVESAAPAATPDANDDSPVELGVHDNDDSLQDFLCEAQEHLTNAEEALLSLEQDFTDGELINTVFRAFHTIKGVAGFMNLGPIVELAHDTEFLLDKARSELLTLNSAHLDLLLNSCDLLGRMIEALSGGVAPTRSQLDRLIIQIQAATNGEMAAPVPTENGVDPWYPPLGEILIAMKIVTQDEVAEALQKQHEHATRLRELLVQSSLSNVDEIEEQLTTGGEHCHLIRSMILELGFANDTDLDEAIEARKRSSKRIGELLGLSVRDVAPALREQRRLKREGPSTEDATTVSNEPTSAPPQPASSGGSKPGSGAGSPQSKKRVDQTVKVSTNRMDNLINMVGELVIAQQMVVQDPSIQDISSQRVQRNLGLLGKIVRDLQEVSMSLRMVTVKGTFQKMARLVRDVAAKANKTIHFEMLGEDTELDRNLVEEIGDPLVHMIRNACDHGIESADERRAAGKPDTGNLTLSASHQGGEIIIEIKDDGRGLNRDKILAKAMERGVYTPDRDPADVPDSEIYNLVFLPGFSTADKVTDISGRGVGMDVVRRNIEALRGKVEISSTPGKGTTFSMRLPLTMAIIDGMVVRVGSQRYVLPTLAIEQSFRPTPDRINTVVGQGEVVSVRGALLPIFRLNQVFDLDEGHDCFNDGLLVVLESGRTRYALMVDEILDQQQVVIKSLGRGINNIRGVSGGAILGDGRVALILDVAGLAAQATNAA